MIGRDDFRALTLAELENLPAGQVIVERRSGGSVETLGGRRMVEQRSAADIAVRLEWIEQWIRETIEVERQVAGARS